VDVVRTVPAVALTPVALLVLGPATSTELVLAVWAAGWPVVLSTAGGVAAIPERLLDVSRMLRQSRTRRLVTIVIPAVVPAWLAGSRTAVIIALHVCLVGEVLVTYTGLGGGLVRSLQGLEPARLWAYALTCGALGLLLNVTLRRLTRLALPGSAHLLAAGTR
jgi:ABC-type nitrate/sulfonate/bicarbonate transport system permease component